MPQKNDKGNSMNPFEIILGMAGFEWVSATYVNLVVLMFRDRTQFTDGDRYEEPDFPEGSLKQKARKKEDLAIGDVVKAVQDSYIQTVIGVQRGIRWWRPLEASP